MVLATERDWTDGPFDRVVVEVNPAVVEEAAERRPAGEGVADGLGKSAATRDPGELALQPWFHGIDKRA